MFDLKAHKFILIQILKDIYSSQEIAAFLGFKGGTACYLFHDLPRFSIDLDFNLLAEEKKDLVFQKIKEILTKYGELKETKEKRFTLFFLLSYGEKAKNIKVEISKRKFPNQYEIKNYLGIPMLVMKKEDILAHKLAALLGRREMANRDLFDLWYFLKNNWPVNKRLLAILTQDSFQDYLKKCLKTAGKLNEKYLLQGLGEVLEEKQKEWIKKGLKKELLFLMRYYLENF